MLTDTNKEIREDAIAERVLVKLRNWKWTGGTEHAEQDINEIKLRKKTINLFL
jgi:hypothetical protein